ncbi:MAG: hypothetical protein B6D58_04135 [candidate division Zixibacteria bacterium 4484_95]|nr:MAG: hypothetical protein B6D58_04135 [candidate division Zixibacteria bacterium 4484_95]
MTFLNSIFLAALVATVIPLLIHFLSRRRIKIVDFSSLKFLLVMQKSKLRWLKIRELLLLLIRMMILAMLALAFARPALTSRHGSSHAPTSAVILIDNSLSTEKLSASGAVYDDIKRGATEIVDLLNANDDITVITLSGKPLVSGPYSDFSQARKAIYNSQPKPSPPAFKSGLQKAKEILSLSYNLNKEIYILSDFQYGKWWKGPFDKVISNDYRYFAIGFDNNDSENAGITKIEFPPQLLAPGEEFEIAAYIRNYDNKAFAGKLVELFIDGNKKAQTAIDLKPFGTAVAKFAITPENPGRHQGYLEIEDDDYNPDNRFYFNFNIPQRISVLGVSESAEDLKVLVNCLGRTGTGYIEFKGIEISDFSRQTLAGFDVIVLNNISALPPSYFNSLGDFVASGGGLFLILGEKSNIEAYRKFINDEAGIKLGEKIKTSKTSQGQSYFSFDDFDLTHPIFKIYSSESFDSPIIPPLKVQVINPLKGGIPLARLSDKTVLLAMAENGRVIVMGTGLNLKSSDISLHSFIVPFVVRAVEYLASASGPTDEYFLTGQPAIINLPTGFKASSARFTGPDCDETIEVARGAYGAFFNIPSAGFPGFYAITADSDTVGFFSVNHDSSESAVETISPQHLKEKLSQDLTFIENRVGLKEEVMQAKFGFELWKYCLLFALILLVAESLLVREFK